jgi:Bifunctional DNA primase/polymerase, N-terminal
MSFAVALSFAKAGIAIIPVRVFREGDRWRKLPHIREWRQRASTDLSVIEEWWQLWPQALPGIVLEHYGRVVVDCDRHGGPDGVAAFEALGPFPPHPIVRTAGNGEQHYFMQTDPPITYAVFAEAIEMLGVGRFVVAPGAGGYELIADVAVTPPLPEVFRTKVKRAHNRSPSVRLEGTRVSVVHEVGDKSYTFEPTQNYFARVKAIASMVERKGSPGRSHTLFKAACLMAEMGAFEGRPTRAVAEQMLMNAAWSNGLVKDYSKAKCRETIDNAYRRIADTHYIDHTHTAGPLNAVTINDAGA